MSVPIDQPDPRLAPLAALPDRLLLPIRFTADEVAAAFAETQGQEWTRHFVRQNYAGDWSVLALRAPLGADHPILQITAHSSTNEWVDTPLLAASPALAAMLARFRCPLTSVRLMRLGPGSCIHEHSDPGLDAAEGTVRLHVPLATNPQVEFLLNRRPVAMALGDCWYVRLSDPHALANLGDAHRVHLVIDAVVDDWLAGLLEAAVNDA